MNMHTLFNSINSFDALKEVERVICAMDIHPDQRNRWLRAATEKWLEACPSM